MSGNIQNVNLTRLKSEIDEYSSVASKLHSSVSSISTDLKNLRTYWTGQRINSLITLWNNNMSSIDEQVFYFAMKIKLILNEIYNQYTAMEKGAPKDSSSGYGWGGILKVELTDSTTIKFEQAKAESIVKNITTNITNSRTYVKQLLTKLDSMQGYSDSLKTLATTYKANGSKLESSLNNLCVNIQTEAQKALSDMKVSEGYNESDARRASTTSRN